MKKILLLLSLLLAGAGVSAAPMSWVDSTGRVHYGDAPPKGTPAREVAVPRAGPAATPAPGPSEAQAAGQAAGQAASQVPPQPANYSRMNDPAAVPYITAPVRTAYQAFLARKSPRAFVICPDGGGMAVYAPIEAEMKKLLAKNLEENKARGCKPYVIDDALVWTGN